MGSDVKKRAKKMSAGFARTDLACESWDGRGGVEYREERTTAGWRSGLEGGAVIMST